MNAIRAAWHHMVCVSQSSLGTRASVSVSLEMHQGSESQVKQALVYRGPTNVLRWPWPMHGIAVRSGGGYSTLYLLELTTTWQCEWQETVPPGLPNQRAARASFSWRVRKWYSVPLQGGVAHRICGSLAFCCQTKENAAKVSLRFVFRRHPALARRFASLLAASLDEFSLAVSRALFAAHVLSCSRALSLSPTVSRYAPVGADSGAVRRVGGHDGRAALHAAIPSWTWIQRQLVRTIPVALVLGPRMRCRIPISISVPIRLGLQLRIKRQPRGGGATHVVALGRSRS